MSTRHSLGKSFGFAFEGLKEAFVNGRNFRIQFATAVIATILGFIYKITTPEWLGLTLIITLVIILELINTSLESIVDIVSPQIQPKAKVAKDVAAASVLMASIAAIIIGGIIFIPKILVGVQ